MGGHPALHGMPMLALCLSRSGIVFEVSWSYHGDQFWQISELVRG